ncbi:hypothetical protein PPROV_000618300 [Pycnococcus provasolii]|uniref:Adenosine deaminase domain-containing protein n=2 Tax=Pycnococcus provasolii TaxID=41880 RepID=A0A830HPS0_9CHLO|nr:hypothetical protein PPROV_000618300 [Pycnococcus provasolii]
MPIPHVELHAHLNGCVRTSTLLELLPRGEEVAGDQNHIGRRPARTLSDCFLFFSRVHSCVKTFEHIRRIALEAIQDFAASGAVHVELRTTPKNLNDTCNKRAYVRAVLEGMQEGMQAASQRLWCRLVLSVNRADTLDEALDTVQIADEFRRSTRGFVVGVELSGNPLIAGAWERLKPAFDEARQRDLRVTLHCAEVDEQVTSGEAIDMVRWRPDRLGHCVRTDTAFEAQLLMSQIPVEICLSSNMTTEAAEKLPNGDVASDHIFRLLNDAQSPVCICTDDPSLFDVTGPSEMQLAQRSFSLDPKHDFARLLRNAAAAAFFAPDDDDDAAAMRAELERRLDEFVSQY